MGGLPADSVPMMVAVLQWSSNVIAAATMASRAATPRTRRVQRHDLAIVEMRLRIEAFDLGDDLLRQLVRRHNVMVPIRTRP